MTVFTKVHTRAMDTPINKLTAHIASNGTATGFGFTLTREFPVHTTMGQHIPTARSKLSFNAHPGGVTIKDLDSLYEYNASAMDAVHWLRRLEAIALSKPIRIRTRKRRAA